MYKTQCKDQGPHYKTRYSESDKMKLGHILEPIVIGKDFLNKTLIAQALRSEIIKGTT